MKKDMSAFISKVNIQIFTLHSKGIVIRGIVAGLWHKKRKDVHHKFKKEFSCETGVQQNHCTVMTVGFGIYISLPGLCCMRKYHTTTALWQLTSRRPTSIPQHAIIHV